MKQEKIIVKKQKGATKSALYTFIMNYLGGTYISQVKSSSKEEAIRIWIRKLKISEIKGFSEVDKKTAIENDFIDDAPVPIKGIANVWFFLVDTKKGYGHVNLIKTEGNLNKKV